VHLSDYLQQYNRAHDISPSTLEHYHWVLASFERLHGPLHLENLTADAVNAWLIWLRERGRSPWTIKQRKISLLVLWRAAWLDGLAPPLPPIRRLRPCHFSPTAWTLEEVRQLIRTAEVFPARPLWTASLIRTGYDTGLRLGDLLSLQVGQIKSNPLGVVQHKTGRQVSLLLRPETLCAVRQQIMARQPSELVWPLWGRREAFYRHFRCVVRAAQIRPGTFRWLRRSAATACERVQPGAGTVLLGHTSRSTTERWYLDAAQLSHPPLPPL
jgi:integrase